ncbi:MAG: ECF transporter S component [Clostridia bacterium]|nr:ECF transporter S component [Clostridia bacterium]
MEKKYSTQKLAKMGMMTAIAVVLGFVKFPIIPTVSFLTYDFADIPILITSFAYGPLAGCIILTIVSFIQAFLLGGDGIYGFVMHMLASGAFIIIAGNMYEAGKSKQRAISAMICSTIAMIMVMALANYFITPFYMGTADTYDQMQEMVSSLMVFICLFNLIKGAANSVITFFVYKRISPFLHKL